MARYDASSAEILVFTFKEGLLSAVAHDLKLEATRFTLDVEGSIAHLELDATSLRVVCGMKDGADSPTSVPTSKFSEIEKNATHDVLEAKKFSSIQFTASQVTQTEVVGKLTLHGQTQEIRGPRTGNAAEFRIDQRAFGIKPYRAMLGALKVKREVIVRVALK